MFKSKATTIADIFSDNKKISLGKMSRIVSSGIDFLHDFSMDKRQDNVTTTCYAHKHHDILVFLHEKDNHVTEFEVLDFHRHRKAVIYKDSKDSDDKKIYHATAKLTDDYNNSCDASYTSIPLKAKACLKQIRQAFIKPKPE